MDISVDFVKQLKKQILASRYIVAKIANAESLKLYFIVGKMVDEESEKRKWGSKVLDMVSERLQQELPGLRGFSGENLKRMRRFYNEWSGSEYLRLSVTTGNKNSIELIRSSATTELQDVIKPTDFDDVIYNSQSFNSVSFTHHFEILTKVKDENDRWYYINQSAANFWTVRHLRTELNNKSHLNDTNLSNNFGQVLPNEFSNKAIRAFKDQYLLDYVNIEDADDEIDERVLEQELVLNIKKFLMSLGSDFSFMGNQYRMMVDNDEYFIDLLFFHRGLQSLVAFELKRGKFKPEYIGKMNFYLSALDDLLKKPHENPSIGIILCKEKDQKKVEYSFRDFSKPMGVATYKTSETLPPELKDALPDAETFKKLME